MEIIDKERFEFLLKRKVIRLKNYSFLDDLRIGLRLRPSLLQAPGEIADFKNVDRKAWGKVNLNKQKILKNEFYLGLTKEEISLPNNIFGIIHSRSIFARLGLDVIQSSFYVSPLFGKGKPLPLVLELSPKITLALDLTVPVAGLLLFQLKESEFKNETDYSKLFPLNFF